MRYGIQRRDFDLCTQNFFVILRDYGVAMQVCSALNLNQPSDQYEYIIYNIQLPS